MKVCIMCWELLDDRLNICNCVHGGSHIFFKDVKEAINHFVNHERLMSKRARKFEELVKERIEKNNKLYEKLSPSPNIEYLKRDNDLLQSLVMKSENTDKEKDK